MPGPQEEMLHHLSEALTTCGRNKACVLQALLLLAFLVLLLLLFLSYQVLITH